MCVRFRSDFCSFCTLLTLLHRYTEKVRKILKEAPQKLEDSATMKTRRWQPLAAMEIDIAASLISKRIFTTPGQLATGFEMPEPPRFERENVENRVPKRSDARN